MLEQGSYYLSASGVEYDPAKSLNMSAARLNTINIQLTNGKYGIFKVLNVTKQGAKRLVPGDDYGADYDHVLLLSDGRDVFEASVDTSINSLLSTRPKQQLKGDSQLLINGSVILLRKYAIVYSPSDPRIHLLELMVIGNDDTLTETEAMTLLAASDSEKQEAFSGAVPVDAITTSTQQVKPTQTAKNEEQEAEQVAETVADEDEPHEEQAEELHLELELTQNPAFKRKLDELDKDDDPDQEISSGQSASKRVQPDHQQQAPNVHIQPEQQYEQHSQQLNEQSEQQLDQSVDSADIKEPWLQEQPSNQVVSTPRTYRTPQIEPLLLQDNDTRATHTLSQLTSSLSRSYWSFKARLTNKSVVKDFEKRNDGKRNILRRLQFQDATGVMEAVMFGSLCNSQDIEALEVNACYQVTGGSFSYSNPKFRYWPSEYNIAFELGVTSQTKFRRLSEEEASQIAGICIKEQELSAVAGSSDMKAGDNTSQTACATAGAEAPASTSSNAGQLGPGGFPLKYPNMYKLNRLMLREPKSTCNVIAIVHKVGKLEQLSSKPNFKKSKLSVRKVTIIDETKVTIDVAFWGTEAEQFDYPVGSILFFRDIELSNYKGLSLSVTRKTTFLEFKPNDDPSIDISLDLRRWWQDNYGQFQQDSAPKEAKL